MSSNQGELDRMALEELHERLERSLHNVVYRWLWDSDECREVVQETFLRLWRMRARVELETAEALAYRIALNLAANRRRSRRLWRMATLEAVRDRPGPSAGADEQLAITQRRAAVREAIDSLPEKLRRVVVLCEMSDLTYEEVGRALGIPAGTVGSRRNAALKLLRQRLGELAPERERRREAP